MKGVKISYGQTFDECVMIKTLNDEVRFKMVMKLFKLHTTIEGLEKAISKESLKLIENMI